MISLPQAAELVFATNEINRSLARARGAMAKGSRGLEGVGAALIGMQEPLIDLDRVSDGLSHEGGGGQLRFAAQEMKAAIHALGAEVERQIAAEREHARQIADGDVTADTPAPARDPAAVSALIDAIDFDDLLAQVGAITADVGATPARRLW